MEKITEVEKLEKIEGDNLEGGKPMIRMSLDSETKMFSYYGNYDKKKMFPIMWRSNDKGDDRRIRHVSYSFGRSSTTKSKFTNMLSSNLMQK